MIEEQTEPCSHCGKLAGWWSALNRKMSMVFHAPNGDVTERRIVESKEKRCACCDNAVTNAVKRKS